MHDGKFLCCLHNNYSHFSPNKGQLVVFMFSKDILDGKKEFIVITNKV